MNRLYLVLIILTVSLSLKGCGSIEKEQYKIEAIEESSENNISNQYNTPTNNNISKNINIIYATDEDSPYKSILFIEDDITVSIKENEDKRDVWITDDSTDKGVTFYMKYKNNKLHSLYYFSENSENDISIGYHYDEEYIWYIYFQNEWFWFNKEGKEESIEKISLHEWINIKETCENNNWEGLFCESRTYIRTIFKENPIWGFINDFATLFVDSKENILESLEEAKARFERIRGKIIKYTSSSDFSEHHTPTVANGSTNELSKYFKDKEDGEINEVYNVINPDSITKVASRPNESNTDTDRENYTPYSNQEEEETLPVTPTTLPIPSPKSNTDSENNNPYSNQEEETIPVTPTTLPIPSLNNESSSSNSENNALKLCGGLVGNWSTRDAMITFNVNYNCTGTMLQSSNNGTPAIMKTTIKNVKGDGNNMSFIMVKRECCGESEYSGNLASSSYTVTGDKLVMGNFTYYK